MKNIFRYLIVGILMSSAIGICAQEVDSLRKLNEVQVGARRKPVARLGGAENGMNIGQEELFRAACCNLGESFVTNPSVDANYNDAAVGARQIKLLGLGGQYVQMLTEGLPMSSGASLPYLLSHVPGPWMSSIAVSKGAASVKQGYQSITGQIDIEYLKPDETEWDAQHIRPGIRLNLYGDSRLKGEGNAVINIRMNERLSTEVLAHYEQDFMEHDMNGDKWRDSPLVRQVNAQNRWKYRNGRYIMHAGFGFLSENRDGGQLSNIANRYGVNTESQRYEAYMKHAYLLNREHNTNIALLATIGAMDFDGIFGAKKYGDLQGNLNAQLMLEHEFDETHSLSAGFSYNGEVLNETLDSKGQQTIEHVPGIYAQYTYNPSYKLTIMAGLRGDYSSQSGFFATPRLHLKWVPATWLTLRASAGKGYRTSHPLAENHYLLASGRKLSVSANIPMEEAWNSGISAAFVIPTGKRNITLNAEYYYTHFLHQAVVDFDSNPFAITIDDLAGLSYSHTAQIDASYSFTDELEATAAFRYNHVMCTYAGILMEKPLQSRYKGLLTISWKPRMGLWHIDFTLQMNGGGRMPKAYLLEDGSLSWDERFAPYPQLNLQVSREFRHFTIYVGGENLTNYRQPTPIINADNPWGNRFEPSLIWGPVHGIMAYAGVRMNFWTKNN